MKHGFISRGRNRPASRNARLAEFVSDRTGSFESFDARQCMIRVWMAITGVWLTFWLALAGVLLATFGIHADELGPLSLIVLMPPVALLAVGVLIRWVFETFVPPRLRPARPGGEIRLPGGDVVLKQHILAQGRTLLVVERQGEHAVEAGGTSRIHTRRAPCMS